MKDIPGFEGLYAVTEDLKVWSYPKVSGNGYISKGKYLKVSGMKYDKVFLYKNNESKSYLVHRLVALTYIPNPHNYPCVRHLDNNTRNNAINNLDWCTKQTNTQQAWDDRLNYTTDKQKEAIKKQGISNGKRVMQLTKEGILCKIYDSCAHAGRITGCNRNNISKCASRRKGKIGGYFWQYVTA